MVLLLTIGLNVIFIMETGRRLKSQQDHLEAQYSQLLPSPAPLSARTFIKLPSILQI